MNIGFFVKYRISSNQQEHESLLEEEGLFAGHVCPPEFCGGDQ
jgi:hypothetical protein